MEGSSACSVVLNLARSSGRGKRVVVGKDSYAGKKPVRGGKDTSEEQIREEDPVFKDIG